MILYISLGGRVGESPSDISLIDYTAPSADFVTPPHSDNGLLQPMPENVESDTAAATNNIHPSEESVKVSENNVEVLVKNGYVW